MDLLDLFVQQYGGDADVIRIFHAPGRVNLIGEHTDYNGGYVFPAALSIGTSMLIRRREDKTIRMASTNFSHRQSIIAGGIEYKKEDQWVNYPKSIIYQMSLQGFAVTGGYDILFSGEIPNGSGLSSSASIEVVACYGLMEMEGYPIDLIRLALLSQKAENDFMNVKCGIMDQFAVAMGRVGHAILLRCDTLEYQYVPFGGGSYKLIIGNTKKERGLADSAYNERRSQCGQAVQFLRSVPELGHIKLLGEVDVRQFGEYAEVISDPVVRNRAQHVIKEIDRVLQSMKVLRNNDLESFGRLMTESHVSLRDLYEVSCVELDVMVEEALALDGVLGSRMTGAGFGGCTVSLVHQDAVPGFIENVGKRYWDRTGITPEFYVCEIGDGVKEVIL